MTTTQTTTQVTTDAFAVVIRTGIVQHFAWQVFYATSKEQAEAVRDAVEASSDQVVTQVRPAREVKAIGLPETFTFSEAGTQAAEHGRTLRLYATCPCCNAPTSRIVVSCDGAVEQCGACGATYGYLPNSFSFLLVQPKWHTGPVDDANQAYFDFTNEAGERRHGWYDKTSCRVTQVG